MAKLIELIGSENIKDVADKNPLSYSSYFYLQRLYLCTQSSAEHHG
jgi:hypothetical protein